MTDNYLLHHWTPVKGCWSKGQSTTIHDRETWEFLQDAYRRAVLPGKSTIAIEPTSGMMVPYEVRLIPGKGRGLFATKDIKKDEVIWKNIQCAKFTNELSWRRFVSSIPYEFACDVQEWAYVSHDEHNEKALYLDLDDGSLTNEPNPGQDPNASQDDDSKALKALRDIKAGEEIIMSYSGLTDNIDWYKRMKKFAWKKGYKEKSKEKGDSTKEEVEPVKRTERNNSTKEETVTDNDPHKISGLINTTDLRKNAINTNQRLRRNELGLGGSADNDQQHDWYPILFFVFPLIMLWYFWKNSRHRYGCSLQKCSRKRYTE